MMTVTDMTIIFYSPNYVQYTIFKLFQKVFVLGLAHTCTENCFTQSQYINIFIHLIHDILHYTFMFLCPQYFTQVLYIIGLQEKDRKQKQ